ncbi:MAG TPA: DNA polymerase IV, partial [Burkholderiales bacterium]|nr:DNA polymerase IV [Burkholderiales bacterium]
MSETGVLPRRILHLDMDAFFAAVELLRRPDLRGQPVVIGGRGDPTRRGVVSTATYEARAVGVRSGMPLRTALKLCPAAIFLPVDFAEYHRYSALFKAVMKRTSPLMEDRGIDEAYLDITAIDRSSEDIAREIKQRIHKTGLTCSIGIAPNKLLAKMASELQKPDGLTVLVPGDLESRIWPLGVRKAPGIGPKTETRLAELGVHTIGELAAVPIETLGERFGRSYGVFLHDAARGIDDDPIVTHWEPKQRSRETTFQEDTGDWQTIARTIAGLAREVTEDLREEGYRARTVGIKLRFADFETHTREKTLPEP